MVNSMENYGGSFVKALANCLRHADPYNYQILVLAFPEYVKTYREMGKKH